MPSKTQSGMVSTNQASPALRAAVQQFRGLFESSEQAMYLFLDDHNKACNARFAKLLGYATPEAWAAVHTSFPAAFVAPKSQESLIDTYQAAMTQAVAGNVEVTWKRKDGKTVNTQVTLVPIEVDGERLALHFIDEA